MQGRIKREGGAAENAEPGASAARGSAAGSAMGAGPARSAGRERPEEQRPEPTEPNGDDRDGASAARARQAGSRLRLRNWGISTRLVALILLPVVAATFFGVIRIQDSIEDIEQLEHMELLTELTHSAHALARALQAERDRAAGPLISGESEKHSEVADPRARTVEARKSFDLAVKGIDSSDPQMDGVYGTVLDIGQQLDGLNDIRSVAYENPDNVALTVSSYNRLIGSLLAISLDMAQATSNNDMIRSTRALARFSEAKEASSVQRAIVTAGLARGERPGGKIGLSEFDWHYGDDFRRAEWQLLQGFVAISPDDDAAEMLKEITSGLRAEDVIAANQDIDAVFAVRGGIETRPSMGSSQTWFRTASAEIDKMDEVEQNLLDGLSEQARQLKADAEQAAYLNGAITLLVLGITLVGALIVARSMVRSLRKLQHTAQDVARKRLPEVVRQMSEADPQDVDTSVEPVGVYTRDEIGKVAEAFDDVHREAVRLAGEQALLRGNVNAMFTNLSRRSQGLIQRQLSLISELESREADPDQLSSLFKLDHLATRMRRNGENLLVLAGEEPGRRWTRPVPLVDVLRAAASEVEQYERIELSAVPKTDVAGRVVNDLVHLLAELLENATSFSSPQTKVKVTGHALPDGRILVEIHDTGIGLSPEDLADINERLANPPTVDVSVSRRMGLFVVGRLSLRHGIRIQLRPSDSGGTTALVMLPADVAQASGRGTATPTGAAASATLTRDNPTMRRAPGGTPASGGLGGAGSLSRPPTPSLGRASSTGPRAALPPRAEAPAPAEASASPAEEPQRPQRPEAERQAAPAGARPSWAAADDTAGQPAVPPREEADRERGHEEAPAAAPGQFTRAAHPAHPSYPSTPPAAAARPQEPAAPPAAGPPAAGPQPGGAPAARPDELTGPLPTYQQQRSSERTPIFEEMESTWFGIRRAVASPGGEAPTPQGPAGPSQQSSSQPTQTPQSASSARAASSAPTPRPQGSPATQAPASVPPPRPDQPASAVPPTAQREAAGAQPGASGSAPWRPSPNDERWRQAEQVRQPSAGGVTDSGLPRRVPRANLVPGAAQQQAEPAGPLVSRAPDDVRGRLTNLRRGIQQGRQAGSSAGQSTDGDSRPRYH